MGILLCEQNFRNVWIRNESVRAEIGQILHTDTHPHTLTHTHTTAAKLVVRLHKSVQMHVHECYLITAVHTSREPHNSDANDCSGPVKYMRENG